MPPKPNPKDKKKPPPKEHVPTALIAPSDYHNYFAGGQAFLGNNASTNAPSTSSAAPAVANSQAPTALIAPPDYKNYFDRSKEEKAKKEKERAKQQKAAKSPVVQKKVKPASTESTFSDDSVDSDSGSEIQKKPAKKPMKPVQRQSKNKPSGGGMSSAADGSVVKDRGAGNAATTDLEREGLEIMSRICQRIDKVLSERGKDVLVNKVKVGKYLQKHGYEPGFSRSRSQEDD